ncbi:MAG: HAD family hydrolase [Butyricicoccus sp.]
MSNTLSSVRGAIFDLDGTVLDSMPCWETVGLRYLLEREIPVEDVDELARRLKTTTLPQAAELYQREYGVTDSVERICADITSMIEHDYRFTAPLKPHMAELLEQMDRQGIQMCIATATDHELACAALERLDVLHHFSFVVSCQQLNTSKNEPLIFDYAAQRLGVRKQEIVVFEDALHSIQTAVRAGYRTIGVYDRSSRQEAEEISALCERYVTDWTTL